ncbi:hypothetical protein QTP70_032131, partial [Hemibagrus guttatus]
QQINQLCKQNAKPQGGTVASTFASHLQGWGFDSRLRHVCGISGKMGKRKDLSEFDKGQIVMARRLDQSISKTAALVGCSRSAVVSIYQKWSKEGTVVNRRQGHGRPRLIDAHGQ